MHSSTEGGTDAFASRPTNVVNTVVNLHAGKNLVINVGHLPGTNMVISIGRSEPIVSASASEGQGSSSKANADRCSIKIETGGHNNNSSLAASSCANSSNKSSLVHNDRCDSHANPASPSSARPPSRAVSSHVPNSHHCSSDASAPKGNSTSVVIDGSSASIAAHILTQQHHHVYAHGHHANMPTSQGPHSNSAHTHHQQHHGGIPRSPDTRSIFEGSQALMWGANASGHITQPHSYGASTSHVHACRTSDSNGTGSPHSEHHAGNLHAPGCMDGAVRPCIDSVIRAASSPRLLVSSSPKVGMLGALNFPLNGFDVQGNNMNLSPSGRVKVSPSSTSCTCTCIYVYIHACMRIYMHDTCTYAYIHAARYFSSRATLFGAHEATDLSQNIPNFST
jgi:hypothetical protein